MHHLTGVYAELIFGNWSYYTSVGGKYTKVKRPYYKHLVFRGVQHGLIPILRSVGVFPTLTEEAMAITPQLEMFGKFYTKRDNNVKKDIKGTAKWIGEQLTKSPPTTDKNGYKKKAVPRDLNELINTVLLQEDLKKPSLLLPHVVACMIRFVQTYDERAPGPGVFEVGWFVDNNTVFNNSMPRYMACIQKQFKEDDTKDFLDCFSDLGFVLDGSENPVALPVMTLMVFEKNNEQMISMFSDRWKNAAENYNSKIQDPEQDTLSHLVKFAMVKQKSPTKSPTKSPKGKKKKSPEKKQKDDTLTADMESDKASTTTPVAVPPPATDTTKKPTSNPEFNKEETTWIKYMKGKGWNDDKLAPPNTVWEDDETNDVPKWKFLHRIIRFDKRVELSNWLASRSPEALKRLSDETDLNLLCIQKTLQELPWDHDMEEIHKQFSHEQDLERKKEAKERKRREEEEKQLAKREQEKQEARDREVKKIMEEAKQKVQHINQEAEQAQRTRESNNKF